MNDGNRSQASGRVLAEHCPLVTPLITQWREEACTLHSRGAHNEAEVLESCVRDIETYMSRWAFQRLTVHEASTVCHASTKTIHRWLHEKKIPNVGRPGGLAMVFRGDLLTGPPFTTVWRQVRDRYLELECSASNAQCCGDAQPD